MKFLMKVAIIAGFAGILRYALSSVPKLKEAETVPTTIAKISVATWAEVDALFKAIDDLMDRYGFVTVADVYDLVGIPANFVDEKYGWDKLESLPYTRDRDEYVIHFPMVIPWKRPAKNTSK